LRQLQPHPVKVRVGYQHLAVDFLCRLVVATQPRDPRRYEALVKCQNALVGQAGDQSLRLVEPPGSDQFLNLGQKRGPRHSTWLDRGSGFGGLHLILSGSGSGRAGRHRRKKHGERGSRNGSQRA
jgi:hypothetical protein